MIIAARFIPSAILFLVIIGFGIWVSRLGKPYHGLLFNIHKLIALGAVILTGARIWRMDPLNEFSRSVIIPLAIAVIFVMSMFATGAIMSIREGETKIPLLIHQIGPIIITLSIGLAVYTI